MHINDSALKFRLNTSASSSVLRFRLNTSAIFIYLYSFELFITASDSIDGLEMSLSSDT